MSTVPPGTRSSAGIGVPQISNGAQQLLRIANNKISDGVLALNRAFGLCLQHMAQLPRLCKPEHRQELCSALQQGKLPESFFGFCACVANAIDTELSRPADDLSTAKSAPIEIAHSAFLALGQALREAAGNPDDADSPLGPNLGVALHRLSDKKPEELQRLLVLHYLGNLLQDFFDSCQVRLQVPELPWSTEPNLRKEDANIIAKELFERVAVGPAGALPRALQEDLRRMLDDYSR
jgi:hypothetical protein